MFPIEVDRASIYLSKNDGSLSLSPVLREYPEAYIHLP